MNTITPATNAYLRTTRGDPALGRPIYCQCCDETRVSHRYQICTACQQYLGEMDEMMAAE